MSVGRAIARRAPLADVRRAALALHALLTLGLLAWTRAWLGLVLIAPLALAAPGLLRGSRYTARWLTMALVLYIAALLTEAAAVPSRHAVALLLASVAALEFVSLVLWVRWTGRAT